MLCATRLVKLTPKLTLPQRQWRRRKVLTLAPDRSDRRQRVADGHPHFPPGLGAGHEVALLRNALLPPVSLGKTFSPITLMTSQHLKSFKL
jgi:hypothetical protein